MCVNNNQQELRKSVYMILELIDFHNQFSGEPPIVTLISSIEVTSSSSLKGIFCNYGEPHFRFV